MSQGGESVWWVSGLRVATDRPLAEAEPSSDDVVDLHVLFRPDPGSEVEQGVMSSADSSGDWFKLMDKEAALAWIRADGRLAFIAEGQALVQGFDVLARRVVPFAAALQDRILLHASAVLADDSVHAFIGPRGVGKSTLARHLGQLGVSILCEDLLHCLPTDSGIVIPDLRLGSAGDSPPSLEAVYFLERLPRLEGVGLEKLGEEECFQRLLEHGFGELDVPKIWAAQFELYSIISEHCRAYRLQVPDSLEQLPEAAASLARAFELP
jgi:hypothetical protein